MHILVVLVHFRCFSVFPPVFSFCCSFVSLAPFCCCFFVWSSCFLLIFLGRVVLYTTLAVCVWSCCEELIVRHSPICAIDFPVFAVFPKKTCKPYTYSILPFLVFLGGKSGPTRPSRAVFWSMHEFCTFCCISCYFAVFLDPCSTCNQHANWVVAVQGRWMCFLLRGSALLCKLAGGLRTCIYCLPDTP